jgi:hypothetical protein
MPLWQAAPPRGEGVATGLGAAAGLVGAATGWAEAIEESARDAATTSGIRKEEIGINVTGSKIREGRE